MDPSKLDLPASDHIRRKKVSGPKLGLGEGGCKALETNTYS